MGKLDTYAQARLLPYEIKTGHDDNGLGSNFPLFFLCVVLMQVVETTLLHAVLGARQWLRYEVFKRQFTDAGARAARHYSNARLATVSVTKLTFQRWLAGTQEPRGDAATVLEFWLGHPTKELLGPAPHRKTVLARVPHDASLAAAHHADLRFNSSHLSVTGSAPGSGGVWHLDGLRMLDGTSTAVHMYETQLQGDAVLIAEEDFPHLRDFTHARRRAMLLGALGARGVEDLYVLDAAHVRRQLTVSVTGTSIPAVYRLDDLTYALLWAMLNVDDSLLADDFALHAERQRTEVLLSQERSAAARAAYPDLSAVGVTWLGSHACTTFLRSRLKAPDTAPLMWSRVQFGEQAAPWLFFRERQRVLQLLSEHSATNGGTAGCVFCVPESAIKSSEPYERLLFLLLLALMESYGIDVWVCPEGGYVDMQEFVLVPGSHALIVDWMSPDAVWHVESTENRGVMRVRSEALGDARTRSVTTGRSPQERLRQAAEYLQCNWIQLVGRCRELSTYGTFGLLLPRSRLIHTQEIERALAFLASANPARQDSHRASQADRQ
ncbi:hypothetical protein [Streptomyces sp. NPDC001037]|uniref:hypothetical protein n=1 Tax=Streptomyces sp. NPDC001037 TaxID=3364542 RepID=UPI0036D153E2